MPETACHRCRRPLLALRSNLAEETREPAAEAEPGVEAPAAGA